MKSAFRVAVFASVAVAACIPPEPPKSAKPEKPCIPEPEEQAVVLATIGDRHLTTNGFGLSRVGDVMDAFRPDVILVDIPPKVHHGDREVEAPLEVAYVDYVASTRGSDVFAIGEVRTDAAVGGRPEKDDEAALAREASALDELSTLGFEALNGAEGTRKISAALNARARYSKGDPDWARHEAWIEHQADAVLDVKKPRRVAVVTGALHRGALEAHMRQRGYLVKDPVGIVRASKDERESGTAPELVLGAWKRQEGALREEARSAHPPHDKAWIDWRISVLELALRRNGGCCVNADDLPPEPKPAADPKAKGSDSKKR